MKFTQELCVVCKKPALSMNRETQQNLGHELLLFTWDHGDEQHAAYFRSEEVD